MLRRQLILPCVGYAASKVVVDALLSASGVCPIEISVVAAVCRKHAVDESGAVMHVRFRGHEMGYRESTAAHEVVGPRRNHAGAQHRVDNVGQPEAAAKDLAYRDAAALRQGERKCRWQSLVETNVLRRGDRPGLEKAREDVRERCPRRIVPRPDPQRPIQCSLGRGNRVSIAQEARILGPCARGARVPGRGLPWDGVRADGVARPGALGRGRTVGACALDLPQIAPRRRAPTA